MVQTVYVYILEQLGVVSIAGNESILAPLSKQTESSTAHTGDLVWLFSACIPIFKHL
jgi:hypothetical protein